MAKDEQDLSKIILLIKFFDAKQFENSENVKFSVTRSVDQKVAEF